MRKGIVGKVLCSPLYSSSWLSGLVSFLSGEDQFRKCRNSSWPHCLDCLYSPHCLAACTAFTSGLSLRMACFSSEEYLDYLNCMICQDYQAWTVVTVWQRLFLTFLLSDYLYCMFLMYCNVCTAWTILTVLTILMF
jgi:hypothetical protein